MRIDLEVFLWGWLPLALAIAELIASLTCVFRRFGLVQVLLALPVVVGAGGAAYILAYMILFPSWPTGVPHIAVVLLLPVVVAQIVLARRPRS